MFGEGYDIIDLRLNKLLKFNVDFVVDIESNQLIFMMDFFLFVRYLFFKVYDKFFQFIYDIYDIICVFLSQKKESFDVEEFVKDLIIGLLYVKY